MSNKKTGLILVVFFILLATGFMFYYFREFKNAPRRLVTWGQNPGHVVDTFSFINQDGQVITDKDVAGKIRVVDYFFATCKGICPKMNENMEKVYKAYRGNNRVVILSHTVDPDKDTPKALKAYANRFGSDGKQWMFLTGDKKRLYKMARESYYITAEPAPDNPADDFIHSNYFVLVDGNGYLRGRPYDGLRKPDVDSLIDDIRVLLEEKEEGLK
jgi:protein SCO1/2